VGYEKTRTTPYRPRGVSVSEQVHSTMHDMLAVQVQCFQLCSQLFPRFIISTLSCDPSEPRIGWAKPEADNPLEGTIHHLFTAVPSCVSSETSQGDTGNIRAPCPFQETPRQAHTTGATFIKEGTYRACSEFLCHKDKGSPPNTSPLHSRSADKVKPAHALVCSRRFVNTEKERLHAW